uniref:Karyopherin subunit alpha 4 n=2 Tax=Bovidae TaxID=9895 RepID=A0AAA9TUW3_BOVIN
MADNEKLDNQRLKNFKNKGRDLEDNFSVEKNTPGVRGLPGDANSAFQRPVFYCGYS